MFENSWPMCHMWPIICSTECGQTQNRKLKTLKGFCNLFICFLFCSMSFIDDTGVSQGLKVEHAGQIQLPSKGLTMWPWLDLNSHSFICFCLSSADIKGMCYHACSLPAFAHDAIVWTQFIWAQLYSFILHCNSRFEHPQKLTLLLHVEIVRFV